MCCHDSTSYSVFVDWMEQDHVPVGTKSSEEEAQQFARYWLAKGATRAVIEPMTFFSYRTPIRHIPIEVARQETDTQEPLKSRRWGLTDADLAMMRGK